MAVLKTKPENLTINEYINEIRDVIVGRNKDTSEKDLDMTACSDDFTVDNDDDDDDEIMKVNFPPAFNDQDDKSVLNDARNDRDNINHSQLKQKAKQIDIDFTIDDKLAHDCQVNDKVAVRIHLNEDKIESIVKGTQDCCSKRQMNDSFTHIIRKVNSKGIEISGDKTQDIATTQGNNGFQVNAHRLQEYENKTQMTDINIGETNKNDPNKERREKFREVIKILKGVDVAIDKVKSEIIYDLRRGNQLRNYLKYF